MASNIEKMFEQLFEDTLSDIDKKMEKAFQNTMKRMEEELFEVMREATVYNYYHGYYPNTYIRTNQLKNIISLDLKDTSFSGAFSFDVQPMYDASKMDHSEYDILTTYQPKKNKKPFGKKKTYKTHVKLKKKPDEVKIMNMTLGAGYHPNVGHVRTEAPIWDDNDEGILWDMLSDYISNNLNTVFNEEFDKL